MFTLLNKGKGWIVPSLAAANAATYSQTGTTLTVTSTGHNIPATTYNGYSVYLAIGSGLATAGWYSNLQRTGVDTFTCVSTVSQTTSGIVNTNIAATVVTEATVTLPGTVMGPSGNVVFDAMFTGFISGNPKTPTIKVGAAAIMTLGNATTPNMVQGVRFKNKNNAGVNVSSSWLGYSTNSNVPLVYTAINTDVDQSLTVSLNSAAANDWHCLETVSILVYPS